MSKTPKKKPKRVVKKTHPLNVRVDKDLFERANKLRDRSWVEIIELALRAVITSKSGAA